MNQRAKSYALVAIQLTCIGIIAVAGPVLPRNIFSYVLLIAGALLGFWAIMVMELGRFNITPDIHKNSRMITKGPYKFIRHPMYTSVLMITLAWVLNSPTILRSVIWIALLVDLISKLKYEEKLLTNRYQEYLDYQKRTKGLIPFIF